jgi:Lsr2
MARNVSVVVTDDLDGSAGAETVVFDLDGVGYEIDLAQPNRARLAGVLAPFVAAGRKAPRGGRRGSGSEGRPRADRGAVRAWAREAGLEVSERGRLSAEILKQYEASH